jgi:site-specific recombinase XerC
MRSYLDSLRALIRFLADQGRPADTEGVDALHIRAFALAEEKRTSPASAAVPFRNLRVFSGWLVAEGERTNANPMDRVEGPPTTTRRSNRK